MVLQLKSYPQLLQQALNYVVARAGLTDLNDSSVTKHIIAACMRMLDETNFQLAGIPDMFSLDSAQGEDLDERAKDQQPSGITRNPATKSTGTIVLTRGGTSGVVNVPAGLVVKNADGISVATTALGTIGNGDTASPPVAAVAVVAGASGNIAAGALKFQNRPAGVDAVSAPSPFVGGTDEESDDELRKRLKDYVKTLSRGTPTALKFAAVGTTIDSGKRVAFAHVTEDMENRGEVTLYIDDGSGTAESTEDVVDEVVSEGMGGPPSGDTAVGGERFLYLNEGPIKATTAFVLTSDVNGDLVEGTDFLLNRSAFVPQIKLIGTLYPDGANAAETFTSSYTAYTGLIRSVQRKIDGDDTDRVTYPGWRAGGIRVTTIPPAVLQLLVQATVFVAEGFTEADVLEQVKEAMAEYVNNLGISGDIIRAELIARAMEVPGVTNVSVISPEEDVVIQDDEVPRLSVGNIAL